MSKQYEHRRQFSRLMQASHTPHADRRTLPSLTIIRAVTGSVAISLAVITAVMGIGLIVDYWNGLVVAIAAFTAGNIAQTWWMRYQWQKTTRAGHQIPSGSLSAPEPI